MGATGVDSVFEATVVGAARRYRGTVVLVVLLVAVIAVLGTLARPALYQAAAQMSVPRSLLAQEQESHQYLDSQVLLLGSRTVAERAVGIANEELGGTVLSERDFVGSDSSLGITPPETTSTDGFGASLIAVSFTWPDARTAQVGANAVLEAFVEVRAEQIQTDAEARVAGVERAIEDARNSGQVADLLNQRTETLVDQQVDLARPPTIAWAGLPEAPVNRNLPRALVLGLVVGGLLGAAVAFARASSRRRFDDRYEPAEIYRAPLLGEIPSTVPRGPVGSGAKVAGRLAVAYDPDSTDAEAFRFVAGSVERVRAAIGPRLALVFVSGASNCGRSEVVANVALALAESGVRVLAIDADTTRHDLTGLLAKDDPPSRGLGQVLAGTASAIACIQASPLHERVALLGGGDPPLMRVTGAAYAKAVAEVLEDVKADFDVVLLDSAPLEQVACASELVAVADAAVVVLGPQDAVEEHVGMVERLAQLGTAVVGYVFWSGRQRKRRLRARRRNRPKIPVDPAATAAEASFTRGAGSDNGRSPESPVLSRPR